MTEKATLCDYSQNYPHHHRHSVMIPLERSLFQLSGDTKFISIGYMAAEIWAVKKTRFSAFFPGFPIHTHQGKFDPFGQIWTKGSSSPSLSIETNCKRYRAHVRSMWVQKGQFFTDFYPFWPRGRKYPEVVEITTWVEIRPDFFSLPNDSSSGAITADIKEKVQFRILIEL